MTEIEIRDPDPTEPGAAPPGAEGVEGTESPYKNLLVPLVVVPALIVMVVVGIVALFSMVTGKESTPRENLDRVLHGGFNERKQAAFNLVQQVLTHQQAVAAGESPEWNIDESFLPDVRAARESVGPVKPGEVLMPFLLADLQAQMGDPDGLDELIEMTRLSDELDPGAEYRLYATAALTSLGPRAQEPQRSRIVHVLAELARGEDPVIAVAALAGLQRLPSDETVPTLRAELTSSDLTRRGTAALSLATLGEHDGVPVLREMLAPEPYAAERASAPNRWPPQLVSDSRCRALEALVRLGEGPAEAELRALADGDPDANVRRTALRLASGKDHE